MQNVSHFMKKINKQVNNLKDPNRAKKILVKIEKKKLAITPKWKENLGHHVVVASKHPPI